MKTCTKCGDTKEYTEFHKNKNRKDGYENRCKKCASEYQKKRWETNKDYFTEYDEANRESRNEWRRDYYHKNADEYKERSREWRKANPEKVRASKQKWEQENPDKVREWHRTYYSNNKDKSLANWHKRRARQMNAVQGNYFPTYQEMVDFYGTNCLYPGCESDPMDRTIDHIVPISEGGDHGLWNFQPLCSYHNNSKNAFSHTDYRNGRVWLETYSLTGERPTIERMVGTYVIPRGSQER